MNALCPPLGRRVSTSAGLFALLFPHYKVSSLSWCGDNKCLEGSFSFDVKKNLVEDHALVGHVIESVTVADHYVASRNVKVIAAASRSTT